MREEVYINKELKVYYTEYDKDLEFTCNYKVELTESEGKLEPWRIEGEFKDECEHLFYFSVDWELSVILNFMGFDYDSDRKTGEYRGHYETDGTYGLDKMSDALQMVSWLAHKEIASSGFMDEDDIESIGNSYLNSKYKFEITKVD